MRGSTSGRILTDSYCRLDTRFTHATADLTHGVIDGMLGCETFETSAQDDPVEFDSDDTRCRPGVVRIELFFYEEDTEDKFL